MRKSVWNLDFYFQINQVKLNFHCSSRCYLFMISEITHELHPFEFCKIG